MPDVHLLEGETVLFALRRHVITLVCPLQLLAVAGALVVGWLCPSVQSVSEGTCPSTTTVGFVIAALPIVLDWMTTWFVLTNRRLIVHYAPIWLRTRSLWLEDIASVSLQAGVLGRVFGFGHVWADTAASRSGRIRLDSVPDPELVRDQIGAAVTARKLGSGR